MPSFDIVSEVDTQEIDNAINQARKELATRFDFKGSTASIEWHAKESISPLGHATQEFVIKQGLEGEKAKEVVKAIKAGNFKVQSALQDRQIRVTGKKKDELQEVIAFCRSRDFGVSLDFKNFRD